jgi:hypothetical protein
LFHGKTSPQRSRDHAGVAETHRPGALEATKPQNADMGNLSRLLLRINQTE